MRVSTLYGLSGNQGTLDFIDVDVDGDVPLFIDPAVLASNPSPWAQACTSKIQDYFQRVLDRITAGDRPGAEALLGYLGEENATHLGYSSDSRGSGVGSGLAERFYDELSTSAAVASGFIADLEDTALLVEGVREDRISDVVTNIIRKELIEFTQVTALFHGIPQQANVAVGPYWDNHTKSWVQTTFDLPVTAHGPLILVPKSIVRRHLHLNPGEYYRHYVLEFFKQKELDSPNSTLVYLLKSGAKRVRKRDVEAKVRERHRDGTQGIEKRVNVDGTTRDPSLLARYKEDKKNAPPGPESHDKLAEATGGAEPDLNSLLAAVKACTPGNSDATKYERAVEALLSALLYPALSNPIRQEKIHDGRKIIDITYSNTGLAGDFFYWLALNFPAANIVVECKNYGRPIANPEFDQISSRFSPSRGKYGILVYRTIEDKQKVMESCRDTARDDRGFVTPIDDDDLTALVQEALTQGSCTALGGLLHKRFKTLMS